MGESKDVYRVLVGETLREGVHLEDSGVDGGDNIKLDLQEAGREGMGWIDLAQDRDRW